MSSKAKESTPRIHGFYLGAHVKRNDNGYTGDPVCIRTIDHPEHTLHKLYDPGRYSGDNPKFSALVAVTMAVGCPAPFKVRIVGKFAAKDPLLDHMARQGFVLRSEEPIIDTIFGNSRVLALREVNPKRQALGFVPYRANFAYAPMDTATAEKVFGQENGIHQSNSMQSNLIIVQDRLAAQQGWTEIAFDLGFTEADCRRIYQPLLAAHPLVQQRYFAGKLSRARLVQLIKLPMDQQPMEMDRPPEVKKRPPRVVFSHPEKLFLQRLVEERLEQSGGMAEGLSADEVAKLLSKIRMEDDHAA